MFKNYIILTFRNIFRQKGYSFLNIFGLSTGIAASLFILIYTQFELSYDTYHEGADRIYRVASSRKTDLKLELFATAPIGAAPSIKENFPEVLEAARCGEASTYQVKYKDKQFIEENTGYADNELFKILSIPFIYGNPETVLKRPRTVVITREISEKYFGDINPVGETLLLDTTAYEVDGVVENLPSNTHLKKDFFLCFQTAIDMMSAFGMTNPWAGYNSMIYIKLKEGINPEELESKIKFLPDKYNGEELTKRGVILTLFLQPIQDIHLYSNFNWEMEPPGNPTYIFVFSVVGILILILACMNYMNLMTARSSNRSNEIGIRKVVGANRFQLITQFMGESLITTLISAVFSVLIVLALLPYFNEVTGLDFRSDILFQPETLTRIILIVLLVGLVSGSYPSFLLSNFKPIAIIKSASSPDSPATILRKILVVSQFAISIMLIIGLLLFYQQVNFMKNKYLGFDKEQKLVVEFDRSIISRSNSNTVKSEILEHPGIISGTFSSSIPGRWMYFWHLHPFGDDKNDQMINCFQIDYDFVDEYNLDIIAGRKFMEERGVDNYDRGWIINEATIKAFGWKGYEDALQQSINGEGSPVIGVVKDFHLKGLQNKIEPMAMFLMSEDYRYLTLKVNVEKTDKFIPFIKERLTKLFPGYLFRYFFLDEDFNKQYKSEEATTNLLGIFTVLGILIALLGLFGLAAFMAEKRTKEIGIRKVLGAGIPTIVFMLTKEFIKWVLIANIIAWPVAYLIMNTWLQDFAYRINISVWAFILSAAIAFLIALLTVSYQSIKVALTNPANSLKYE